jgi:hypothetical protein
MNFFVRACVYISCMCMIKYITDITFYTRIKKVILYLRINISIQKRMLIKFQILTSIELHATI